MALERIVTGSHLILPNKHLTVDNVESAMISKPEDILT